MIAIEGVSGSGKTAVAERFAAHVGAEAVPEAYDRLGRSIPLEFQGRDELGDLERRLLKEEGRRWTEAVAARSRGRPVVLDTATFGPLAYAWGLREGVDPALDILDDLVRSARRLLTSGAWGIPDLVVYLEIPFEIARARVQRDPVGHPAALADRHATVGRWERLLYGRELPRRVPGRFLSLTGEGDPGEVARRLAERLESLGPLPPARPEEAEQLLRTFEGPGTGGPPALRHPKS